MLNVKRRMKARTGDKENPRLATANRGLFFTLSGIPFSSPFRERLRWGLLWLSNHDRHTVLVVLRERLYTCALAVTCNAACVNTLILECLDD